MSVEIPLEIIHPIWWPTTEQELRDATEAAFFCFVKLQPKQEPPEPDAPNHVIG